MKKQTAIWMLLAMLSMAGNIALMFQLQRVESELEGCQTDWLVIEGRHSLYTTNYFYLKHEAMGNFFESNYVGEVK